MTREEQTISNLKKLKSFHNGSYGADINRALKALSTLDKVITYCKKSPSAILPEDVLSLIRGEDVEIETDYGYEKFEPKTGQFAEWVATEIFDENWEYNKDAFAELACRKLEKLGIVRAKGGEWELVEHEDERNKK